MQNKPEEQTNQMSVLGGHCPSSSIANDFNPASAAQRVNPYPVYARARKEAPIFFSPMVNAWVVTRYDDVMTILKDHTRFSLAQQAATTYTPETLKVLSSGFGFSSANPNPWNADTPEHIRVRSCVNKVLTAKRVDSLEPHVRAFANQLIDQFIADGEAEIVHQFAYPYPARVFFSLLGMPEADMEQARVGASDFFTLLFTPLSSEPQTECARNVVALQRYLLNLVELRRGDLQDDLLSDLIRAIDSDEELMQTLQVLVIASFETTACLIGNCLYHLLFAPHHWQALVNDPALIPSVVEETLRLDGPSLGFFRMATQDVTFGEVTLPRGSYVLILFSSANHDEAYFQDPELFNPHRENLGDHLAFGHGIHFCLGSPLAKLNMRVALEQLSQRLPHLHLKAEQELSYISDFGKRGLKQLYVQWDV